MSETTNWNHFKWNNRIPYKSVTSWNSSLDKWENPTSNALGKHADHLGQILKESRIGWSDYPTENPQLGLGINDSLKVITDNLQALLTKILSNIDNHPSYSVETKTSQEIIIIKEYFNAIIKHIVELEKKTINSHVKTNAIDARDKYLESLINELHIILGQVEQLKLENSTDRLKEKHDTYTHGNKLMLITDVLNIWHQWGNYWVTNPLDVIIWEKDSTLLNKAVYVVEWEGKARTVSTDPNTIAFKPQDTPQFKDSLSKRRKRVWQGNDKKRWSKEYHF